MPEEPWYKQGLHFGCRRCERCCRGAAGNVFVSDEEIAALAKRLDLPEPSFRAEYTRPGRKGLICLREKRKSNWACVFLLPDEGCAIYEARPKQCRTYPFWRALLHSSENWAEEAKSCPGMNCGPWHSAEEILAISSDDGLPAR